METVEQISKLQLQLKILQDDEMQDAKTIHNLSKEIERLRLANSDLQMHYDYARTECDKLEAEVKRLRGSLQFIAMVTPLSGESWQSIAKFIIAYAIDELKEKE